MSFLHAALTKERVRVAQLTTLYEKFGHTGSFLAELSGEIELDDEDTLPASAWLLRRYTQDHPDLPHKTLEVALDVLANSNQWVPRLHLCQIFSSIDCPPDARDAALGFLFEQAQDSNAFIRAWALTALHRLKTTVASDDRHRIARSFKQANSDTAKCVQARLRQLRGKQPKTW